MKAFKKLENLQSFFRKSFQVILVAVFIFIVPCFDDAFHNRCYVMNRLTYLLK